MNYLKNFLKAVTLFLVIPAACILIALAWLNYKNNQALDKNKIGDTISTIFIGDSHVQMGIDDAKIANSINLAQNSEFYYYNYYKIQGLLKYKPNIKKIYLGFSYHSLSSYVDDYVFGKYSTSVASRYFFILPGNEKMKFVKYNLNDLPSFLRSAFIKGARNAFLDYFPNEFENTQAVKKSMDKRLANQFYSNGKLYPFSTFNLHWLDEIVKLCRDKKLELILLNTPLHPYYKSNIPVEYIDKYNELVKQYQLPVKDFATLNMDDACFIPDGDHVSVKGANLVAAYLSK